jgi:peptidoglycan-associated lipoprotein
VHGDKRLIRGVLVIAAVAAMGGCAGGKQLVRQPKPCQDQRAQIYFEPDSAEMTAAGQAILKEAAAAARGCEVEEVQVVGLADAVGAPDANLELSKRRAEAVSAALAAAGLPPARFEVAAAGQADAVTSSGEARPVRRRADVLVKLRQPK